MPSFYIDKHAESHHGRAGTTIAGPRTDDAIRTMIILQQHRGERKTAARIGAIRAQSRRHWAARGLGSVVRDGAWGLQLALGLDDGDLARQLGDQVQILAQLEVNIDEEGQ